MLTSCCFDRGMLAQTGQQRGPSFDWGTCVALRLARRAGQSTSSVGFPAAARATGSRGAFASHVGSYEVFDHGYDAVVIGAGGAGLRAAAGHGGLVGKRRKSSIARRVNLLTMGLPPAAAHVALQLACWSYGLAGVEGPGPDGRHATQPWK